MRALDAILTDACEWLAANPWRTAVIAVAIAMILAGSIEVPGQ